ncbi:hypothetical protein [Streptomyces sp. NPDC018947]|uniref:hypothetical protein n=1 Tax=Streptomyces sp. NPDC018947 TaxID=3365054 RepID=UPI0037A6B21C
MRPLSVTGSASPASGALRGLRAGVLAVLCVLLPLAGHALNQCHAPRWVVAAAVAGVAVPGAALLTRRRLTDTQVAGVLLAAQIASHLAYSLPGACRAMTDGREPPLGLSAVAEHGTDGGPPAGVLVAGHLITVFLAARLLGVTERLLWQSKSLPAVVRGLLLFAWAVLGRREHGTGPRGAAHVSASPLRSAVLARRGEGRAPPSARCARFASFRPLPIGGPVLP